MRRLVLALVVIVTGLAIQAFPASNATFISTSSSSISVSTASSVSDWLHLYSQSTDPGDLAGYFRRPNDSALAATGQDFNLSIDLGTYERKTTTSCKRVFTITTPDVLPTSGQVTVTASLVADPHTWRQPIADVGFVRIGQTAGSNPVTIGAGEKLQVDLVLIVPPQKSRTYRPGILITVSYPGYSGNYYQYDVPVVLESQ